MSEVDTPLGFRTYEVYQRERVGETTNLVNPRDLLSDDYLRDPFTVPGVLREHYPCYRDWVANQFWITRYDDVTSVFADEANFASRPLTFAYGDAVHGTYLGREPQVKHAWSRLLDQASASVLPAIVDERATSCDMVGDFVDQFASGMLAAVLGDGAGAQVATLVATMKRGVGWDERLRMAGIVAFQDLTSLVAGLLSDRRAMPADDLLTVFAELDAAPQDVAVTLLEADLDTLPASMANLWCLLLTNEDQLAQVRAEPRLMKFAYLEALRHSPPLPTANRYTRHEVERFGRLLPEGALMHLSAAAANRDPRCFADPDVFDVARKDLCQREPRGQYRADGLPAGIVFGHGRPSRLPAMPKEAPRSSYAQTRDIAVAASLAVLERFPGLKLAPGAMPTMALDRLGGTYQCRQLPVVLS